MLKFAVAALLVAVAAAGRTESEYETMFGDFIAKYSKTYASDAERASRFDAFKATVDRIDRFKADGRQRSYTVGINKFSDMSRDEFKRTMLGFRPTAAGASARGLEPAPHRQRTLQALPADLDWRKQGVVSTVKDQGQCGSCWSFSATGAIEGAYALASNQRNKDINVCSEQNIIDCSWESPYNNTGCNGGDMRAALQYVIDNKGIDSEKSYKYVDYNGGGKRKCAYDPANKNANITSMVFVQQGNETDLAVAALASPVSVAIDASQDSFQDYESGIYDEPMCGNKMDDLDHGVLVVGFGTIGSRWPIYFWIVKNSWGEDWGEDGYIQMLRNHDNMCGIATYAQYAVTA